MNADFVKRQYVPVLKGLLNFHAQVLSALGKQNQSEAKAAAATVVVPFHFHRPQQVSSRAVNLAHGIPQTPHRENCPIVLSGLRAMQR